MNTYHIHIGGLVQGVGFRPFVCRLAEAHHINGWVSNGNDGVHIEFSANKADAEIFYQEIITTPPANAIVTAHHIHAVEIKEFNDFVIRSSDDSAKPDLLLTPDIAICKNCRQEIAAENNKRFQYPFTTCLECGPRYSIITALPYDRSNITMAGLKMCAACELEYNDVHNRRHFSQTNSCIDCSIPLHFYDNNGTEICSDVDCILVMLQKALEDGHIVAVKGIGGYLLLCDASNPLSIETLRDRKHRPAKPFAVMYPSVAMMEEDLVLTTKEKSAIQGKVAPIVLCKIRTAPASGLCTEVIAPGLDKVGAMLPYTPLLLLILQQWNKPLIATSGNLSGSPIIYRDEDALEWLIDYADFILAFDRDIVMPQDDSVVQFTEQQQRIVLRRSRGMAPNYYPSLFTQPEATLAMGAEMKSAFAVLDKHLYVSQYLGDQGNYESQLSYKNTLLHLLGLLKCKPEKILIDDHPGYFVSNSGKQLAQSWNIPVVGVQHHKAHFAAVLAENDLLRSNEAVLGVVWDGTGFGDDDQVWGGEFFMLEDGTIERTMHLEYFPQLLGDKMSKEPRVSAVSLLRNNMDHLMMIKDLFSAQEREYYLKLLKQRQILLTSSMGRLLDGIAAILKIQSFNTYEGEAAMKLEAVATRCKNKSFEYYPISINKNRLDWLPMIDELMIDNASGVDVAVIARKVFVSLAMLIKNVAARAAVKKIAFSGGVFQNALLVDLIIELLKDDFQLYFHKQLSPNDECIGFGQIAYSELFAQKKIVYKQESAILNH